MQTTIFKGTTLKPFREFISQVAVKNKVKRVILPCAGRMTTAENLIANGIPPQNIYCSDITLYTSVIGYYFDPSKSVYDLGIWLKDCPLRDDTEEEFVANVLYALKRDQFNKSKAYEYQQYVNLVRNKQQYLDDIKTALVNKAYMKGLHYDMADVMDVMAEEYDEDTLIYLNPPLYAGGYQKMFPYNSLGWNDPGISFFEKEHFPQLIEYILRSKATVLCYAKEETGLFTGMQTVFAYQQKKNRTDYLVSNRSIKSEIIAKIAKMPIHKYAIYDDSDITEDTKIEIIQVNHETAMYYRDLFVHKLGTTKAERYFLFLIDGKVTTAFGLAMRDVNTGKSDYAGEVFGISITSYRYKRLGKLFMLCLTCEDFHKVVESGYNMGFREIKGIKTSSITTYAEGKTDRSVMKLIHRELMDDGRYRVVYRTDWWDRTYKDCLKLWLEKWGGVNRK